jgi:hypothetical protein
MSGNCSKPNCSFLHDQTLCKHFYQGHCKFGDQCNLSHNFKQPTKQSNKKRNKHRRKKNTESFEPDHSPPDMRLLIFTNKDSCPIQLTERDVIVLPNFFNDVTIYNTLLREMENSGFDESNLWKLWHGDSHLIADDKLGDWKSKCPTFMKVINAMRDYFHMDIKATRFNWYKDNQDWKPYHRDAAAIDERKAKTQNITVAVTFGDTRTASFQHMTHKTRIDLPLADGSVYVFNKQVNVDWMHGIIQEPEIKKDGRISIICWGYCNQIQ